MFKKSEKNKEKGEKEKVVPDPIFNTHKMPKGYKVGRFDYSKNGEDSDYMSKPKDKPKHTKKLGFIIVFLGAIIVLFLGYIAFAYIKNPDFSFNKLFDFKNINLSLKKININSLNKKISSSTDNGPSNNLINNSNNLINNIDQGGQADLKDDDLIEDINDTEESEVITEIENVEEIDLEENLFLFLDDDLDGLSNDEETLLGTNKNLKDSDGDGYDDLVEVLNLYNPAGTGAIIENPNIEEYQNDNFKYSVLYPKSWEIRSLSDGSSVIFSINESSFVQIIVEKNENSMNIRNWYTSRFFNLVDNSKLVSNSKWDGIYSEDGLALYLTGKDLKNVYTILYNFPENQAGSYINIFKMIVSSFNL